MVGRIEMSTSICSSETHNETAVELKVQISVTHSRISIISACLRLSFLDLWICGPNSPTNYQILQEVSFQLDIPSLEQARIKRMSACEAVEVNNAGRRHQRYGHLSWPGKHECTGERGARRRCYAGASHRRVLVQKTDFGKSLVCVK